MVSNTRIAIADDHALFREGLKLILGQYPQIQVCASVANGKELVEAVQITRPDLVIADINMPAMDGIDATKIITRDFPQVKVIALSMYGDQHLIVDMLEAGAKGFLLKDVMKDDVVNAIKTVMDGYEYYCNSTSMQLARMIAKSPARMNMKVTPEQFSEKETEVMRLICEEYASKEIAVATELTLSTVETYRKRIFEKIGCKNLAGVVVYAVRTGIFKI